MFRAALSVALVCLVALVGGAGSVAYVLASGYSFGAVRIGPWTAFPEMGTREADPYAQAEVAIEGILSLGRAEGIGFVAERDSAGALLDANCTYLLAGQGPPGRFWTLRTEPSGRAASGTEPAIHSRGLLRKPDNSVEIAIGRKPFPGNWLPVRGPGRLRLVLTVYDGSATTGPVSTDVAMPEIRRIGCDA